VGEIVSPLFGAHLPRTYSPIKAHPPGPQTATPWVGKGGPPVAQGGSYVRGGGSSWGPARSHPTSLGTHPPTSLSSTELQISVMVSPSTLSHQKPARRGYWIPRAMIPKGPRWDPRDPAEVRTTAPFRLL